MNKKFWYVAVLVLSFTLLLAACGDKNEDNKNNDSGNNNSEEVNNDGNNNDGEEAAGPQEGGTLVYALDSEPPGVFNWAFYGNATDAEVMEFFDDNLIDYDEELKPQPNIADWETEDDKVFTFTFKEGVKWHNGEELTVEDWVFAIETIADPDYPASRYANVQNIEGAAEYRVGDADSISGLNVISDYEIEITFDKARVNNLENLWTYPMSRAEFEGMEVADMEDSPQVRTNPVGLGPFKITNIIPGESIQFEAFEDYWQGKPYIDDVVLKIIDPSLVVGELKQGSLDITAFHPSNFEEISGLDNAEVLRTPGVSYYYVGFNFGSWDGEKVVMDNDKYQNQDLRLAMAHAIDRDAWIEEYFYGLGSSLNRVIPSTHWIAADDADLENHFEYDPELAMEILDEAGYVIPDGEEYRVDPDGNEFVVKFSHYDTGGNADFETRAQAITQYWNDIGLATELEMADSTLYYDSFEKTDPELDFETFFGGWSTGADPDPTALWASNMIWNFPRWADETNDQLLEDALDIDIVGLEEEQVENRQDIYTEWQQNINEFIPMIPIAELEETRAISSRLQGVELQPLGTNSPHEWWIEE